MPDGYDSLLDRLTARLGIDPELSLEVRKELRTHLEEAEKDFADGSRSAEEARQLAIKALGDEDILAKQLWNANRSRVKLRRWIRRGVLVAMIPLAIIVTLWPMWDAIPIQFKAGSERVLAALGGSSWPNSGWDDIYQWNSKYIESALARLPEKDRFLFTGDPSAKTQVEKARSIRDRWPEDPVYQANLAREMINSWVTYKLTNAPETLEELSPVLDELERGRAMDPTNGYWDLVRFALLAEISTRLIDKDPNLEFKVINRDENQERMAGQTAPVFIETVDRLASIQIIDAKLYAQATEAMVRAMDTRRCNRYWDELMDRRLALLPKPQTMRDLIQRMGVSITAPGAELEKMRWAAQVVSADALTQAKTGHTDLALSRIRQLEQYNAIFGSQSNSFVELLVARRIEYLAVQYEGAILQVAGDSEQVAANFERQRNSHLEWFHLQQSKPQSDYFYNTSVLMHAFTPSIGGYNPDPQPLRVAEYAMIEQVSIFISLMIFDLLALGCLLASLWILWNERRSNHRTPLLWIGWRRLAWVLGLSVLLPMAIYIGYLATPWSSREWGLHVTWRQVLNEHVILLAVMLLSLGWLSARAIRQRAREVGCWTIVEHPFRRPINGLLARLILVAASIVLGFVIEYLLGVQDTKAVWICLLILACVWGAGEIIWLAIRGLIFLIFQPPPRTVISMRLFIRGWAPILTCAVVLIGAIGYSLSRTVESSAIGRAKGGALIDMRAEIEESNYKLMRDRMKAKAEESMNRYGSAAISKP